MPPEEDRQREKAGAACSAWGTIHWEDPGEEARAGGEGSIAAGGRY